MLGYYFGFFHGVLTVLWKKPALGETRALAMSCKAIRRVRTLAPDYRLLGGFLSVMRTLVMPR
jgi:hypothetical protein